MTTDKAQLTPNDVQDFTLYRGGAIAGFAEVSPTGEGEARPGTVAVTGGRVVDAGPTAEMDRKYAGDARRTVDLPGRLLLPGMVNAHTHLELTTIGPQPYGGDFIGWVAMLREHWPGEGEPFAKQPDESWFAKAAAKGSSQSMDAGVQAVGDITRFEGVVDARCESQLAGVSFIELFGMGPPWDTEALARLAEPADGFQPHAPYSAGPSVFDAACSTGRPVSCHLAETLDELRFIAEGDGPFLDLLQSLGKWSPDFAEHFGQGLSPVRYLEPCLRRAPWVLAHCNYVSDDDIALLAETNASVAYCPIASEYFGHGISGGGHRYRDMLDAGVNVCLGTDSIVCQPANEPQPLGILPQMRRLYQRDQTDPSLLLQMATAHGQRALQLDGGITRIAAVPFDRHDESDALTQVLQHHDPVQSLTLAESPS
ncbi:MAG: amidohydrolase family protein [Planctomycetota bacterium]